MMGRFQKWVCVLLVMSLHGTVASSQETARGASQLRYMDQIADYVKQDSLAPPAKGSILFIGSSIFRLWKNLPDHMAPLPVYNRAFGGSRTGEILLHMEELVYPHAPRIIVYYCGSNDVNANVPTVDIAGNFRIFAEQVHRRLPKTRIMYVSVNRAPQKMSRWSTVDSINALAREICSHSSALTFVDVNPALFDSEGRARVELYKEDKLHFKNDEAYLGFARIIKPVLEKWWTGSAH